MGGHIFGIKFPWQNFEVCSWFTVCLAPYKGFQNPGSFACAIRNLWSWNPEYSSRNPESHKGLESGIQVPLTKNWNPVPRIRNPWRGIQNPRLDSLTWGDSQGKNNRRFGCEDLKTTTHGFVTNENKFNDFTFVKYSNNWYPSYSDIGLLHSCTYSCYAPVLPNDSVRPCSGKRPL